MRRRLEDATDRKARAKTECKSVTHFIRLGFRVGRLPIHHTPSTVTTLTTEVVPPLALCLTTD